VQVDPIKPKLKPPGGKRLKPMCAILLSTSAFKINMRRYIEERAHMEEMMKKAMGRGLHSYTSQLNMSRF